MFLCVQRQSGSHVFFSHPHLCCGTKIGAALAFSIFAILSWLMTSCRSPQDLDFFSDLSWSPSPQNNHELQWINIYLIYQILWLYMYMYNIYNIYIYIHRCMYVYIYIYTLLYMYILYMYIYIYLFIIYLASFGHLLGTFWNKPTRAEPPKRASAPRDLEQPNQEQVPPVSWDGGYPPFCSSILLAFCSKQSNNYDIYSYMDII